MPRYLTIRNLTSSTFAILPIDRFEPSVASQSASRTSRLSTLKGNVTSKRNATLAVDLEIGTAHDSEAINHEETSDIKVDPFRTIRTNIVLQWSHVTRLRLQTSQAQWLIDLGAASHTSSPGLRVASGTSTRQYTAIFNITSAVLALFESPDMSGWMAPFPDSTPLSALSIPGTHNSPTCYQALPSVRCQVASPKEQLHNGIRFFDVRVQVNSPGKGVDSDSLDLVHSAFPIKLTGSVKAADLFAEIYSFLSQHPTETVIMSLKREGRGNGTDALFSERLRKHFIVPNAHRWYTRGEVPRLAGCRGKIVLLRRFGLSTNLHADTAKNGGFGIDATNWADNTPNHYGGSIQIQDFYEVSDTENIDKKIEMICDHFLRAGAAIHPIGASHSEWPEQPLFLNFLSGTNFWRRACWPEKTAAKINPAIKQFLCERHNISDDGVAGLGRKSPGDGGLGVVVCDWVGVDQDWDLVKVIVGMNSKLLLRAQQHDEDAEAGIQAPKPVSRT